MAVIFAAYVTLTVLGAALVDCCLGTGLELW
jgi:hypothetical protein